MLESRRDTERCLDPLNTLFDRSKGLLLSYVFMKLGVGVLYVILEALRGTEAPSMLTRPRLSSARG